MSMEGFPVKKEAKKEGDKVIVLTRIGAYGVTIKPGETEEQATQRALSEAEVIAKSKEGGK
jgi:hypothetical protein